MAFARISIGGAARRGGPVWTVSIIGAPQGADYDRRRRRRFQCGCHRRGHDSNCVDLHECLEDDREIHVGGVGPQVNSGVLSSEGCDGEWQLAIRCSEAAGTCRRYTVSPVIEQSTRWCSKEVIARTL